MIFPLWAAFGLAAAIFSAAMMLMQERLKVNGYAVSFWIKVSCALVTLPFVLHYGVPSHPLFYIYLGLTAVIYAISDVIFFGGITKTSAGAVARLIPASSVLVFILWFIIEPALLYKYLDHPTIAVLIFAVLCLFAFFAMRLKKCEVTMRTLREIWYVLFAAIIGTLFTKLTTFYGQGSQIIYSYVFFQALMMMALWLIWLLIKKPIPLDVFFAPSNIKPGLLIGVVACVMVLTKFASVYFVDNPAYIPAVITLDSVIILLVYRLTGKKAEGDLVSGMGIVACAAALIVLKAQV
jgi:hypothetical protein